MIQSRFDGILAAEAIGLSHGQFRLVVESFHDSRGNLTFGAKPVEEEFVMLAQAASDFLHRFQFGSHRPCAPLPQELLCPASRAIRPELLKILALGNRQIEEGRVVPAGAAIKRLRESKARG